MLARGLAGRSPGLPVRVVVTVLAVLSVLPALPRLPVLAAVPVLSLLPTLPGRPVLPGVPVPRAGALPLALVLPGSARASVPLRSAARRHRALLAPLDQRIVHVEVVRLEEVVVDLLDLDPRRALLPRALGPELRSGGSRRARLLQAGRLGRLGGLGRLERLAPAPRGVLRRLLAGRLPRVRPVLRAATSLNAPLNASLNTLLNAPLNTPLNAPAPPPAAA
ncbi:MAG: hypothetical protein HY721_30835, partial [Planctomycetes bacterium]|nr:hypothetical protein [Planctomycetota bacterium]